MIRPILAKNYQLAPEKLALDIGAGNGDNAFFLSDHGFKVVAIEKSKKLCEEIMSKNKEEIQVLNQDIRDYKFPKGFGLIFAGCVLHFLKERAYEIIKKMQEATLYEGINIVIAFLNEGEFENAGDGYFKRGELKGIYSKWEILIYEEKVVSTMTKDRDGKLLRQSCAFMIARKKDKDFKI